MHTQDSTKDSTKDPAANKRLYIIQHRIATHAVFNKIQLQTIGSIAIYPTQYICESCHLLPLSAKTASTFLRSNPNHALRCTHHELHTLCQLPRIGLKLFDLTCNKDLTTYVFETTAPSEKQTSKDNQKYI